MRGLRYVRCGPGWVVVGGGRYRERERERKIKDGDNDVRWLILYTYTVLLLVRGLKWRPSSWSSTFRAQRQSPTKDLFLTHRRFSSTCCCSSWSSPAFRAVNVYKPFSPPLSLAALPKTVVSLPNRPTVDIDECKPKRGFD